MRSETGRDFFVVDLNKIFAYFGLEKSLQIKLKEMNSSDTMNELLNTSGYRIQTTEHLTIDFSQLVQDLQLNFYDKNFTQCSSNC